MGFKRLDSEDFVVSSNTVTSTVWSNNQIGLDYNNFHTSTNQTGSNSSDYYINIYNEDPDSSSTAEVQFSIAYGNKKGLGGNPYNSEVGLSSLTPTRTIYGQYRTLIFEDENQDFDFGISDIDANGDNMGHDFFAINIERSRYKEKLLPGSFNLKLDASGNPNFGGSFLELTDNSNTGELPLFYGTQRAYQIISGSNGVPYAPGIDGFSKEGSYGLFLPDISVIILNARALRDTTTPTTSNGGGCGIGLETPTDLNEFNDYPLTLLNTLNQQIEAPNENNEYTDRFTLNSQETITSDYIFIRTRNSEFNYSENPSFISGSTGEVVHSEFIYNPQSFATTVGLYNDSNELLAVAKLSRPLLKDFTKEALIRVKLDF